MGAAVSNRQARRLPPGTSLRLRALARAAGRAVRQKYGEVGFVFVSEEAIRALNRTYRNHDRVTDVLSFAYGADPVSGEVVMCLEQAARQAARRNHDLRRELDVLAVHGLLHLAGHDHMKPFERARMRALERKVLSSLP